MLWPVVKALLGHYRRHPLQMVLVLLGLTLGVSLLVGVTTINQHAKQSYSNSGKIFTNPFPYRIQAKHAAFKVPQGFYVQLRQAGFTQCYPFDVRRFTAQSGINVNVIGFDPVAMLALYPSGSSQARDNLALSEFPYPVLVGKDLAQTQGWANGQVITMQDGSQIGPIKIDQHQVLSGSNMLADMQVVRQFQTLAGFSRIACKTLSTQQMAELKSFLPDGLKVVKNNRQELSSLTKAFHMNLTAMGLLAFLVGLFIFYQAMSMTFVQRLPLIGSLRQLGVTGKQVVQAVLIELTLMISFAWLAGNGLGLLLANQLIYKVATSLNDLYGANVGLTISMSWSAAAFSLFLSFAGTLAACFWPLIRLRHSQPIQLSLRLSNLRSSGRELFWQAWAALAFALLAWLMTLMPKSLEAGFLIIVFTLLSVALITPYLLWKCFRGLAKTVPSVVWRWFFSDAASSMSYRGIALMAFLLALAANIGVETMVGSFRDTTDKWLSQRLASDLYLSPTHQNTTRIEQWLLKQPQVDQLNWRWQTELHTARGQLQVVSTGDTISEFNALTAKASVNNYWYLLHHSRSLMVSESMALKYNIAPGDRLDLVSPLGSEWLVVGVYYDYGNPYNQLMLSQHNWSNYFDRAGSVSIGVQLYNPEQINLIKQRLEQTFHISSENIYDSGKLHQRAMGLFDRTFFIADALCHITLVIAVIGLFFATLSGEVARQRQTALLRCLGVTGKELIILGGGQLVLFALISALVAVPLGIGISYMIVDILLQHSFGWSIDWQLLPWQYTKTIVWAMCAMMLAGALPVWRLIHKSAITALRRAV